jgi:hypothetical protein
MSDTTEPEPEKDLSEIVNDVDEPAPVVESPYEVSLDEMLSDEVNTLTPDDVKKLKQIGFGILGALLLITLLSIYGCQPKKGSMAYGLCSTFLELNTVYPQTLNYIDLEGSRTAVRIYYTSIDPFGQYKQEMLECKFGPDAKMGMKMTEAYKNRRLMDAELVKKFNMTLPTIMASDPYLVMPGAGWENQLLPR